MGGYAYGQDQPIEKCPYCGAICEADFVDIGVGYQQCGPYHCAKCGASEIGPYDDARPLHKEEIAKGWYSPGTEPGSSANVIDGRIVSHRAAKRAYAEEFTNNVLWHDKRYVGCWWSKQRRKRR